LAKLSHITKSLKNFGGGGMGVVYKAEDTKLKRRGGEKLYPG